MRHPLRAMFRHFKMVAAAGLLALAAGNAHAVNGVIVEAGKDDDSSRLYRLNASWNWDRRWFNGGNTYLSGQWEVGLGYITKQQNTPNNDSLVDLGATPILRWYSNVYGARPYIEVGLGFHLISNTKFGNRDLATEFQFNPSGGIGLSFGADHRYELGYRYWHASNANFKTPNPGLDFHIVRATYLFNAP